MLNLGRKKATMLKYAPGETFPKAVRNLHFKKKSESKTFNLFFRQTERNGKRRERIRGPSPFRKRQQMVGEIASNS